MVRTSEQLWFKKGQEMLPFSKAAVCFGTQPFLFSG